MMNIASLTQKYLIDINDCASGRQTKSDYVPPLNFPAATSKVKLMEMPRASFDFGKVQGKQLGRIDRNDIGPPLFGVLDLLHLSMHPEELAFIDERPVLLVYGGFHYYVTKIGFVVQRQKDNAFCRTGSLFYGHLSRSLHWISRLSGFSVTKSR